MNTDRRSGKGTILCLVNAAAYSRNYFEELAPCLRAKGYDVAFALDSHLTDVQYGGDRAIEGAWYFTDYIRRRLGDLPESPQDGSLTWQSLFSDFDRFLAFEVEPPLREDSPVQYRHIPPLLREFFKEIWAAVKPVAVLYEPVSNSFAIAAYEQAVATGLPFCSLSPSRIPGRIELSTTGALADAETVGRMYRERAISAASREAAERYSSSIDQQVPDYMKTNQLDRISLSQKYLSVDKIAHFLRGWRYRRHHAQDLELAYQHGDPVAQSRAYFKRALLRRLRQGSVARYYQTSILDEPFLLYPLHFHPEASTSIYSGDYVDELSTIKAIAFRLPLGVRLYVKEHPSAVALQPLSFYRQLADLPNVRLLGPQLPTKAIARRSRGVITLTSTVGFEAAVMNRPVITLGNVFYNYFPNVRNVVDYSALSKALAWALDYVPLPPSELIEATAAYVEFGTPGSFDFLATLGQPEALRGVADLVDDRLSALRPTVAA